MSFWKTFGFHAVSPIDNLLDSGEFTLEQLLDEDEILQETKAQNKKLLDFLVEPTTLKKLLFYITVDPEEDADTKRRFKYPFLSCEVLASEVWAICDAMFQHEGLLDDLYSYFEREAPLDPISSSYASRVANILLTKKVSESIAYMKSRQNMVPTFLKHLGNASVMDLLLKVISCEDTTDGAGTLDWLCTTDLIQILVDKFDPKQGSSVHENAAQALGDIIAISVNSTSSPLIAQLESEPILKVLFGFILVQGLSSSLEHGLSVVIELLHRHMNNGLDDLTKMEDLPTLLKIITQYLEPLHDSVKDHALPKDDKDNSLPTSTGAPAPLGFQRLKILEFFSALTHTNFLCLDIELHRLGIFATCVRIFFAYPWNNFLHSTVEQMIQVILDCESEQLKLYLVTDCKLVDLICEASKLNEEESSKPKGVRRGYMGHITAISTSLLNAAANTPQLESFLAAHDEWNRYNKGAFQVTRERESNTLAYAPSSGTKDSLNANLDDTNNGDIDIQNDDDDEDENVTKRPHYAHFSNDFPEGFNNDANEGMDDDEYENENGNSNENAFREEFYSGDQDLDDDDEEEGIVVQSKIDDNADQWEEREATDGVVEDDGDDDEEFTEVTTDEPVETAVETTTTPEVTA